MDPSQPHSHSVFRRLYSTGPSLVCVGGMLRVDHESSYTLTSPQQYEKTTESQAKTTPFKALVSPFTSSVPFTAPTTPCSSSLTPIPRRLSSILTPRASLRTHSAASTPLFTPDSDNFFIYPDNTKRFLSSSGAESAKHLLTPKQVRELRRLCRKTANRAEFEERLIQVRQIASISAMGSSSVHLFDPGNPHSGQDLRIWVETHRASGADWRDERPLSNNTVVELRRWDRQLKVWARSRVQSHSASVSTMYGSSKAVTRNTHNHESALQPVRLEFERISIETPPITPLHLSLQNREREKSDGRESRAGTDRTTVPTQVCSSFQGSMAGAEVSGCAVDGTGLAGYLGIGPEEKRRETSSTSPTVRSPWRRALFSAPYAGADGRKPLAEVVIHKRDDIINIALPKRNIPSQASVSIRKTERSLLHMTALEKENLPSIRSHNTWRNAILHSTAARGGDPDGSDQNGGVIRMKNPEEFRTSVARGMDSKGLRSTGKSELDWGALRGGRGCV